MKKIAGFLMGLAVIVGVTIPVDGSQETFPPTALRDTIEELQQFYSTQIVLGEPLEVDALKIIPLATIGIGYGQQTGQSGLGAMRGTGGILSPVGVLVVSKTGVQLFPIPKGVLEQLLGAISPVVLHLMKGEGKKKEDIVSGTQEQLTSAETLAALYSFLPSHGLKFGLFPWPLSLVIGFLVGWLALAFIISAFLPHQVTAIAFTLQENYFWTGVMGLLSYGVVFILAVLFTITIIGIPLTFVLVVVTWALKLLGTVSIAFLVGQRSLALVVPVRRRSVSALQRIRYSEGIVVLVGGVILALIRIIPVLGWIIWLLLGIFGFGAVLQTQRRNVQRETQS